MFSYFRWNWDLFKDYIHFYIMIGAIPIGALIVGSNIMVGSAVLKPIPEGTFQILKKSKKKERKNG